MFFQTKDFKVLEAGVQAAWLQQQLHMQNLANIETPNYKAKSLVFDEELKNATGHTYQSDTLSARIVTDESTSVRLDGNNVDSDVESLELYKAYVQYSMLLDKVKSQFENYNAVLNSSMK